MPQPEIIFEEKNFVVINKPAGFLTHHTHFWAGGKRRHSREFEPALSDWLLERYPETAKVGDLPESRPGIAHRLDKDTSGAIIIARNQEAFLYLKKLFLEGKIKKTYLALVWGKILPEDGLIDKPIGIAGLTLKRSAGGQNLKKAAPAITRYETLKNFFINSKNISLLKIIPETGRTHQIRVHLASVGHPILGDKLYGFRKEGEPARQMLHAAMLEFEAPDGEHFNIEAPPPEDFMEISGELGR